MKIGTKLQFPNGFASLTSNQNVHLLNNSSSSEWVTLVDFVEQGRSKRADFHRVSREDFDEGLLSGAIQEADIQPILPPWLHAMEGVDIYSIEVERNRAQGKNTDRAEYRVSIIYPLVKVADDLFLEEDPARAIAEWARINAPEQNATRVRLWFACYLVFGRHPAALYPSYCQAGHYNREHALAGSKFGRRSRQEHRVRCRIDQSIRTKIVACYTRFADVGVTQREMYTKMLTAAFNCKVVGKGEQRRIISMTGEPYPSINQFRYWVKKAFAPDLLKETLYGATRFRHKLAPDRGQYSHGVANLMEVAEADGYNLQEQLTDFDGQPLGDGFCVVRLVDRATGAIAGIGFALGAEVMSAYRMALFCAAIPKSAFGRLVRCASNTTHLCALNFTQG